MTRRLALLGLALALVAGLGDAARADGEAVLRNAEHRFELELVAGPWQEIRAGADDTSSPRVAALANPRARALLAISRVDYPNADAWRGKELFFDQVEEGVKSGLPDGQRLLRRVHKVGRVPVLDLAYRFREQGRDEVVLTRFLFFRTYSMVLTVAVPYEAYAQRERPMLDLVRSFKPYFAD